MKERYYRFLFKVNGVKGTIVTKGKNKHYAWFDANGKVAVHYGVTSFDVKYLCGVWLKESRHLTDIAWGIIKVGEVE